MLLLARFCHRHYFYLLVVALPPFQMVAGTARVTSLVCMLLRNLTKRYHEMSELIVNNYCHKLYDALQTVLNNVKLR
jgi:hypothetical protein